MMEKKLVFKYLFGNICGQCEYWSGYVCMIAKKQTCFIHECDVELPEKDQCEPYDTNKNKVVSIKIEDLELNGWHPIYEFPNNDRIVNVMYDDGSTSDNALGFCDEISSIPPTGKRIWWELRNGRFSIYSHFIAWRDL